MIKKNPRLGVNIDHVATLRQARGTPYPDVILAAHLAENAGADQITCHLREDRRHIQDADLVHLRKTVKTKLNLEMAATPEMLAIALKIRPNIVTLVPEKREELTTEGGLDLFSKESYLTACISELKKNSIPVSLFINPDLEDMEKSAELGVYAVELHTGQYAEEKEAAKIEKELERLKRAAHLGIKLQLKIFAGHGLHYDNLAPLIQISEIEEYNIGHSIIARSVFVGLEQAIREMKVILAAS